MNNNQNPQQQAPEEGQLWSEFFSQNYNSQQFKTEFKQKTSELGQRIPFLTMVLTVGKLSLYILSFFTNFFNQALLNSPEKVLSSFQMTGIYSLEIDDCSLCDCLLQRNCNSDALLHCQAYLPKRVQKGLAIRPYLFFYQQQPQNILAQPMCIISLPLIVDSSLFKAQNSHGVLPLILIEVFIKLMKRPSQLTEFCWMTLPQKYVLAIVYVLALFFFDEGLINILATSIVGYLVLHEILLTHLTIIDSRLISIETKTSAVSSKCKNFIVVSEAIKNLAQDSDSLGSFDRRQMRGRVSSQINQSLNSTQASVDQQETHGGVSLGGDKSRDESILVSGLLSSTNRSNTLESEEDYDEEGKLNN